MELIFYALFDSLEFANYLNETQNEAQLAKQKLFKKIMSCVCPAPRILIISRYPNQEALFF